MSRWFPCLIVMVYAVSLMSCQDEPVRTPVPQPPVPKYLLKLPVQARMECGKYQELITVWALPGLTPPDPTESSAKHSGMRGDPVGRIESCERVVIRSVSWSSWEGVYYVYIESGALKGWVEEKFVEVEKASSP